MVFKRRRLRKIDNGTILKATSDTIEKADLVEVMRNSRKVLMTKAEFEKFLNQSEDRVSTLHRVTSITKGIAAKYYINSINGGPSGSICAIIIRTPFSIKVKLPYKKYIKGSYTNEWKIGMKTVGFKRALRGAASGYGSDDRDDLYEDISIDFY